jgi:hypothetical protein
MWGEGTPETVLPPSYITTNFGLVSHPTEEGSNFFRNVGNDLPDRAASRFITQYCENFKSRETNMGYGTEYGSF